MEYHGIPWSIWRAISGLSRLVHWSVFVYLNANSTLFLLLGLHSIFEYMLGQLLSYSFYFWTFFDTVEYFFLQVNFRISLLSYILNKNPVGILNKIILIKLIIIPLEKTIQEQCGPLNLLKYNFMSFSWVLCTSCTFWAFLIGVFLYILYFFGYYKW